MPFAGYKDFDDCVKKIMSSKGFDKERASAYCAVIEQKVEEGRNMENEMRITPSPESPSQYAVPDLKKLPIQDAAHVRNAMARFNQTQGLSPSQKADAIRRIIAAAKKYGIDYSGFVKKYAPSQAPKKMSMSEYKPIDVELREEVSKTEKIEI